MKSFCFCLVWFAALTANAAADAFAAWWWDGKAAENPAVYGPRLEFLSGQGVNELYFCARTESSDADVIRFVRAARAKGMRVARLAGDVSWINPGNLGFYDTAAQYFRYQKTAPADARYCALHLDVEPHQNPKLSDARRWQLYADFVQCAAALVHRRGEKIEWDIPFWLNNFKVCRGEATDVPLHQVVMDCSDGVTLMSYRDTAKAMLDTGREELEHALKCHCRVLFGAETGETGEGDFVTYFEASASHRCRTAQA